MDEKHRIGVVLFLNFWCASGDECCASSFSWTKPMAMLDIFDDNRVFLGLWVWDECCVSMDAHFACCLDICWLCC
ncbi:MAG: hypothetical protein Q6363_006730 [Candidatus Njordarchaeota archaeon]